MSVPPMDWDSDPELQALRREYIASFPERQKALGEAIARMKAGSTDFEVLDQFYFVAHKIAGSAESYGLPSLGRVGAGLDEYLSPYRDKRAAFARELLPAMLRFASLLDQALADGASGKDPSHLASDPRMLELTSCGGSTPAAPKPGPS